MPSFRRRESVIDADRVDHTPEQSDVAPDALQAQSLAEEAEAEAAEAEALAAAARARARAIRLRRQAAAADVEAHPVEVESKATVVEESAAEAEPTVVEETSATAVALDDDAPVEIADADADADVTEATEPKAKRSRWRMRRPKRPSWKRVLAVLAVTLVVLSTAALLALSGYMVMQHREAAKLQQQNAEYTAAGRQSVVTLMSLDFNKAQEGVQRIIDNATGQFKTDFENQAADFVKVAQDSKVVTEVTVNSVAVESMTDTSATVLVAASSRVTNTAGANQEPRTWRLSVNLEREGDQIKMSKVEFVP